MTNVRVYLLDLGERVAKTFVQVFLGQLVVSGTSVGPADVVNAVQHWSSVEKAFVSAAAAVVAILMGLVLGWANSGTASAVPKRLLPGQRGSVVISGGVVVLVLVIIVLLIVL